MRSTRGSGGAVDTEPDRSAGEPWPGMPPAIPVASFAGGATLLAGSAGVMLLMVLEHLVGLSLPGCGTGGACARAAQSIWGRVPGVGWPVSFVGLAYFVALLVAWGMSRRRLSRAVHVAANLGALVSLAYVLVLVLGPHGCLYCIAAHAGNIGFWMVVGRIDPSPGASARPGVALVLVFLAVSMALGVASWRRDKLVDLAQERALERSVQDIVASLRDSAPAVEVGEQPPWDGAFTGRYHRGPTAARVRLVIFTDYQCQSCQLIEAQIRESLIDRTESGDVSISVKHFPMCAECNPQVDDATHHRHACRAARAAEAAGILQGGEGFWRMHDWLVDRRGRLEEESFRAGLRELGFDPERFLAVMEGDEALTRIQSDIQEGTWLGLRRTPMIFVNGTQLHGAFARNGLRRAVEAVLAEEPPVRTAQHDRPPRGERAVADSLEK